MHVIKECEQMFRTIHLPVSFHQRIMDGKAEQDGHQRVPLFASFRLPHRVPPTCFVFPLILCRLTINCPNEWQQSSQTKHIVHFQHGASEDVVVRSNAINGEHCCRGICVGHCPDGMSNTICACSGGECKLIRCASCLSFCAELTNQRCGNQPPERGACGDAPNSAVMLLQRRHGCNMNALDTLSGTFVRAKSSATLNNNWTSASSRHTLNISLVHPPGPANTPDGPLYKHLVLWDLSDLLLGSLPLLGCQCCARHLVTGTGNLAAFDPSLGCLASSLHGVITLRMTPYPQFSCVATCDFEEIPKMTRRTHQPADPTRRAPRIPSLAAGATSWLERIRTTSKLALRPPRLAPVWLCISPSMRRRNTVGNDPERSAGIFSTLGSFREELFQIHCVQLEPTV